MLKLSIVVISINGAYILEQCLASLHEQCHRSDIEVLVVGCWDGALSQFKTVQKHFHGMRWISVPNESTVPQMRTQGITNSRGEIVALLEDDCLISENWCNAVLEAHNEPHIAIGGAIEPSEYQKSLDWAVYFCEYARFMLPLPETDVGVLPGINASYKRNALLKIIDALEISGGKMGMLGFYEYIVHMQILASGYLMKSDPSVVVSNINTWHTNNLIGIPFHHGRGFAGLRFGDGRAWLRYPYLFIAFILPVLKTVRTAKQVLKRKRLLKPFFLALPGIVLFFFSWSIGEFIGYLFGPGNSLQKWR